MTPMESFISGASGFYTVAALDAEWERLREIGIDQLFYDQHVVDWVMYNQPAIDVRWIGEGET